MTGPVRPATDPTRVTADDVQIVWDEEGPDGVADWIRGMAEDERAELCQYCPNDVGHTADGYRHCIECGWTDDPGRIVDLCNRIDGLEAELALRRSGIATAPPCTDGYWRNEKHPPPPSAAGGENADPRETT